MRGQFRPVIRFQGVEWGYPAWPWGLASKTRGSLLNAQLVRRVSALLLSLGKRWWQHFPAFYPPKWTTKCAIYQGNAPAKFLHRHAAIQTWCVMPESRRSMRLEPYSALTTRPPVPLIGRLGIRESVVQWFDPHYPPSCRRVCTRSG